MKPSKKSAQRGQSMIEYAVVACFFTAGIMLAIVEGDVLDQPSDLHAPSLSDGINFHEQHFKDQMMMP